MSTLKFGTDNAVTGATFSLLSGSSNAQFPLTNIDKVFTTKVFRSTGTSCVIEIDMQSNQVIDTIALVGNNLTGLGITAATIEFSPTTSFLGTTIHTIDLSADHNFGFKLITEETGRRYAKLTLTGTSFCELSNIYIGSRTELTNNNIDTSSFGYSLVENYKAKSNNYGQLFIDKFNSTNILSGNLKFINLTEFEQLNNMYAETGNTIPIWVFVDSDGDLSTDFSSKFLFSGYFYLEGNELSWQTVAPKLYNTSLSFIEVV